MGTMRCGGGTVWWYGGMACLRSVRTLVLSGTRVRPIGRPSDVGRVPHADDTFLDRTNERSDVSVSVSHSPAISTRYTGDDTSTSTYLPSLFRFLVLFLLVEKCVCVCDNDDEIAIAIAIGVKSHSRLLIPTSNGGDCHGRQAASPTKPTTASFLLNRTRLSFRSGQVRSVERQTRTRTTTTQEKNNAHTHTLPPDPSVAFVV